MSKIQTTVVGFCKTVSPVSYRASGFFLLCSLSAFLCTPSLVSAGYEEDIILAASQGDAEAQYALALLYEYGSEIIARDKHKSFQLLQQSAQKQIAGACLYMGLKYEYGNGVSQDFQKAVCYYRCAALQDWPMAQFFLADLYIHGKGVEKSTRKALAWLGLAREHEYPRADSEFLKLQKQSGMNDFKALKEMQGKLMLKITSPCD